MRRTYKSLKITQTVLKMAPRQGLVIIHSKTVPKMDGGKKKQGKIRTSGQKR